MGLRPLCKKKLSWFGRGRGGKLKKKNPKNREPGSKAINFL
jgi:hypothetical protein